MMLHHKDMGPRTSTAKHMILGMGSLDNLHTGTMEDFPHNKDLLRRLCMVDSCRTNLHRSRVHMTRDMVRMGREALMRKNGCNVSI